MPNSPRLNKTLTIYGRKPVLEALQDAALTIDRLHLADSNRPAGIIDSMLKLAASRNIDVQYHSKKSLSFISKNSKQDQGVAADIFLAGLYGIEDLAQMQNARPELAERRFLLLDGITNPQNLGMLVRSTAASGIAGLIVPKQGNAELGPLAIKASAGAFFRCPLLRCQSAAEAAQQLRAAGAKLLGLDAGGIPLEQYRTQASNVSQGQAAENTVVYVLGNESEGISTTLRAQLDASVSIPMYHGVESLNAAVAGSLIAFM